MKSLRNKLLYPLLFILIGHNLTAQTINVGWISSTPFCSGDEIGISVNITGTFNSGNTFFVEMSDASGSFASPTIIGTMIGTTSGLAAATIPASTPSGTYSIRVHSNDPDIISNNTRTITVAPAAGNPALYGNGVWNVYAYKSDDFTNYGGFFQTGSALNFDSKDYFADNGSPSDASGYSGCVIPNNNHSYSFKRTNFPCGYYVIDIPQHNNDCELIIDGNSVYTYVGYGGPRNNVWTGILGPNSEVEFKIKEFTGTTEAVLTFTPQSIPIAVSPSVSKCASATATLSITSPVTMNYTWSPSAGLSSTTGASVTTSVTTNTTYTITAVEPNSGCVFTENIDVNIIGSTPVVSISPTNPETCPGESINLIATGAANYTWYEGSNTSGTVVGTGAILTVSPTTNTTYTVLGDDGCTPTPNYASPVSITVNVGNASTIDDSVFGNNEWRIYAYQSNGSNHFDVLLGYYTESSLSFDTQDRWHRNNSPSDATGYVGCNVPVDNFGIIIKRTGFSCGMYQIDIGEHNNDFWLYINGELIESATGYDNTFPDTWRGFLTPNSTIEYRQREYGGGSYASMDFISIEPIELASVDLRDPSICPGFVTLESNIKNYNNNVLSTTNYSWTDGTTTWTTPNITVAPTVTTTYNLTVTKDGCTFTDAITVNIINDPLVVTISPTSPEVCAGGSVILTAFATSGGTTYTWYEGTTATGTLIGTGASISVSPTVNTSYTVVGDDGCQTDEETVTVTVGGGIDPNTFGNNKWAVFAYDGQNFINYYGYYEENTLNFDSRTTWTSGNNGTPSDAPGYVGCPVPTDQHSVRYKRKGFPCGYYQIDLPYHDDGVWIYIDGTEVYHKNTWFDNNPQTNVWEGFLGPNTEIELRWNEGGGGSGGALSFNDVGSTLGFVSSDVTICEGTSTTLTASFPSAPLGTTYTWSADPTYIILSSTTGTSVTATAVNMSGANNGVRTVTCTVTDPTTTCALTNTIDITVDPLPSTTLTASKTTICEGETITLSSTGANTYTWSANPSATAGMSTTTGNSITATPTETTTYTVSGNNNCATIEASVTVTVLKPTIPATTFGDGEWNAFVYEGDLINSPSTAVLTGHYTEKSISFNSTNRWGSNSSPSDALTMPDGSQGYLGCPVGIDNHSVAYRRTNFPCGFYQISVANHDDDYELYVDGALVSSSSGCCQTHLNVWSGLLDASSTVEFRWREGSGNSRGSLSIGFALSSATTLVWTGGANNTDWFNPLNWCPGSSAPTALTDVIIPGSGVPTQPVIDAAGAVCKDLNIETGASLNINTSYKLDVYGNWKNNGTFTPNSSIVHLEGATDITLGGNNLTTFYTLDVDKSTQTVTMTGAIGVNQALVLNGVELALNRNTLSINNPDPNTINRTGDAFINGETNDATNLSIICWNTSTTIGTYVYPFGVSFSEYIPVTFNKKVSSDVAVCVSTRGTAADNLPYTTGTHMLSASGGSATTVVDRWWDISVTGGSLPMPAADITFSYRGSENTIATPTDNLAVQHFDYGMNDWELPLPNSTAGITSGIGTVTAVNVQNYSPFIIGLEATPLPVDLLYFNANKQGEKVILDWATTFEENSDYFEIERSRDGKVFEVIDRVYSQRGGGQSNKRFYETTDLQPYRGISYYRLTQTDFDGTQSKSHIESVNIDESSSRVWVSPNPTDNENIELYINAQKDININWELFDNQGVSLYQSEIKTDNEGYYNETLKLPMQLPAGLYIIKVYTKDNILTTKFIIQ